MTLQSTSAYEFSRAISFEKVKEKGEDVVLEASPEELEALAQRLGVMAVKSLQAKGRLVKVDDGRACFDGKLQARVVQACVITLEPVAEKINEEFRVCYSSSLKTSGKIKADAEIVGVVEADEPMTDGFLELGEPMVQILSVAMNPYPKAKGAQLEMTDWYKQNLTIARQSPFAKLAALKAKGDGPPTPEEG